MNSRKSSTHAEKRKSIDCSDIYINEMTKSIKTLKRFRELWLNSRTTWNSELFQYADPDFYFYRFAIDRQEKSTEILLTNILYQVMAKYELDFEISEFGNSEPFTFVICEGEERFGYRFADFYPDEDVNTILEEYELDKAFILRTWKPGKTDEWILRENKQYLEDGIKIEAIMISEFFQKYFGVDEYNVFTEHLNRYLQETREITGYKSIKFLSSMNLATQKIFEEKYIAEWPYNEYQYQIIDANNEKMQDYLYLSTFKFSENIQREMERVYLSNKTYRTMVGINEYAESFITSEWLFHSLKEKQNFDYTSVISGYLKSIEQLLCKIVMLNVDNSCKILMTGVGKLRGEAHDNNVTIYANRNGIWSEICATSKKEYVSKRYSYIDLITGQEKYMDSSIGTFEYFLRNNPHIFINESLAKTVADMVSCFRTECRNGFFHTHNLKNWSIVEKTRDNAIYLYFVLLGACAIPQTKNKELGITVEDFFDELCKKIRGFSHYNTEFIFEYAEGRRINLIYDFLNNTAEYTDEGIEHYKSLLFYEVEEFSMEAYEELDAGIKDTQKVYLTRECIPYRIYGVHRNRNLEEITI